MALFTNNRKKADFNTRLNIFGTAFRSAETEHAFRRYSLAAGITSVRAAVSVILFFNIPGFYMTLTRPGDLKNPGAVIFMLTLFLLYSLLIVFFLQRVKKEGSFDKLVFGYIAFICLAHMLPFGSMPVGLPDIIAVDIVLILLLYILFPIPVSLKIIFPVAVTIWSLKVRNNDNLETMLQLFILYILINTVGFLFSLIFAKNIRIQYALFRSERESRELLRESKEKYRHVVDNVRVGILVVQDSKPVFINRKVEETLGITGRELMEKPDPFDFIHPEERETIRKDLHNDLASENIKSTEMFRIQTAGNRIAWIESMNVLIRWEGRPASLNILTDITERKTMQDELERLAMTDPLTGADNRRSFLEKSSHELERARRYGLPVALLMMDIDHFKKVNDTYGHEGGDDVLKAFVSFSRKCLRSTDIFGRLGGEEFAALLVQTEGTVALDVAERIRRTVEDLEITSKGRTVKVTVSIGLSSPDNDCTAIEELLHTADMALYEAKNSGRNRVVVK